MIIAEVTFLFHFSVYFRHVSKMHVCLTAQYDLLFWLLALRSNYFRFLKWSSSEKQSSGILTLDTAFWPLGEGRNEAQSFLP